MQMEIIVPRLGWSMEEGAFVAWLKQEGDLVRAGEPLFSIEGDKAAQEIDAIDSGILRIAPGCPKPGDPIRVGDVLGHLVSADKPRYEPENRDPARGESAGPQRAEQELGAPVVAHDPTYQSPTGTLAQRRRTPAISPRALRVAAELGVDWTTVTGNGKTGRIRERDIRAAAGVNNASSPVAHPGSR
jgi:pyruvate dehydrogenase E2 component (dihydrolipoamide acetyltransferase)